MINENTHVYFRVKFKLKSPLSIGIGESSVYTDRDVVLDSRGVPLIPASSLAGVLRHSFNGEVNELFGDDNCKSPSKLKIYDAVCIGESFCINKRDSVKLEDKVAAKGAKFDFQIVEPGAEFVAFFELDKSSSEFYDAVLDALLKFDELRFGSKTTRGLGEVEVTEFSEAKFNFPKDLDRWLDFDMFSAEASFEAVNKKPLESGNNEIVLTLKQNGALSIRQYMTDVIQNAESAPDYVMMTTGEKPVIPGTSWAGMFRQRFQEFTSQEEAKKLFGFVEGNSVQKSKIFFSESIISDYKYKTITRNSIDRFSAKTKTGALYTERTCYNGETELVISFSDKLEGISKNAFAAVLTDFHRGYLALGGLTAVGRGLFTIKEAEVNGKKLDNISFESLKEAL